MKAHRKYTSPYREREIGFSVKVTEDFQGRAVPQHQGGHASLSRRALQVPAVLGDSWTQSGQKLRLNSNQALILFIL